MGTRRWFGELEAWLRRTGKTTQQLAERSEHSSAHVLELFAHPEPNPKLALYLELVQTAGARFAGVTVNEPVAAIARIKEIIERESDEPRDPPHGDRVQRREQSDQGAHRAPAL